MKTPSSLVSQSRIRRSATQWRDIIRQYKQSGQTQAEFCNGYSLALSTFSRWHQRLTGHSDTVNVDTGDGRRWRIAPHLLSEVKEVSPQLQATTTKNQQKRQRRKKKKH